MTSQGQYRLETTSTSITRLKQTSEASLSFCVASLKRQVPRLRDWNSASRLLKVCDKSKLETTSTSITRLKQSELFIERDRRCIALKRQVPRLRDWNIYDSEISVIFAITWNDKYLDYEIETTTTTLRDTYATAWNDKYLDYEIETALSWIQTMLGCLSLKRQVPRLRDWNQGCLSALDRWVCPWNDKYLDYEIETNTPAFCAICAYISLKRQVPRLRDWNDVGVGCR